MKLDTQDNTLAARIAFLRTVPLFSHLPDAQLDALTADFSACEYAKGEPIFWQGDSSAELYLVRRGKVRIYKINPGGRRTSINIFSGGDIVGEFAAVDRQPRSATAQAVTDCIVWRMDGDIFVRHLCTLPDLALALNRLLIRKLRWTAEFAETMAHYDAAGRLLHILLLYNEQFGEAVETGKRYELELGLNQDDLASLVGTNQEWINRLLQTWRRQGWLDYKSGKITIHDLPEMRRERDRRLRGDFVDRHKED
jgi:CRP-like cAMP-binding protein